MQTERKELNTYLLENHQCLHQNVGGLSLGSVACTSKEMVAHYGRSELNKGTLGLYSLSSKTRKSWQRLAVQRAACSMCATEIKPQVLLEHTVLLSLSPPAAIGWLWVSDGNITPQLTQNCTRSFAATHIYDLQSASSMPPNNKGPQICLHLQRNQTTLSRSASFLGAL